MRITRDMIIAGVAATKLRDAFKRLGGSEFSPSNLAELLELPGLDEEGMAHVLLEQGYIEPQTEHLGVTYFTTTIQGCALAMASAAKPINRATAERLVREVIERAITINAEPKHLYGIKKIIVFGSYLSDCPTLGDVDLAVELAPRFESREGIAEQLLTYSREAEASGRQFKSSFARLAWATEEIYLILKSSSNSISLHDTDDAVLATAKQQVIYEP